MMLHDVYKDFLYTPIVSIRMFPPSHACGDENFGQMASYRKRNF